MNFVPDEILMEQKTFLHILLKFALFDEDATSGTNRLGDKTFSVFCVIVDTIEDFPLIWCFH